MDTLVGITAIAVFIIPIWYLLLAAAYWKMFKKAGEPGWKGIIPLLNIYVMFKFCWKTSFFWLALVCSIGATIFSYSGATFLGEIFAMVAGVIYIVVDYYLARSFGKRLGYTAGLVFLNPIFMLILGLGRAEYEGNKSK